MANESDKKLPEKAPVGEFPFNQVKVWPDGRELHINYTPGNFTTRFWTHTGTGFEIDKDGRFIQGNSNNSYNYTKGGLSTTTDKNSETKTGGGTRTSNDGGSHTENGQSTTSVTQGSSTSISKTSSFSASAGDKGEELVTGNKTTKVTGSVNLLVMGNNVMYAKGNNVLSINGESSEEVSGNKNSNISGNYQVIVADKLTIIVPNIEFRFTKMDMNGSELNMNIESIKASGSEFRHNGSSIGSDHIHSGVMRGGALTDPPAN